MWLQPAFSDRNPTILKHLSPCRDYARLRLQEQDKGSRRLFKRGLWAVAGSILRAALVRTESRGAISATTTYANDVSFGGIL